MKGYNKTLKITFENVWELVNHQSNSEIIKTAPSRITNYRQSASFLFGLLSTYLWFILVTVYMCTCGLPECLATVVCFDSCFRVPSLVLWAKTNNLGLTSLLRLWNASFMVGLPVSSTAMRLTKVRLLEIKGKVRLVVVNCTCLCFIFASQSSAILVFGSHLWTTRSIQHSNNMCPLGRLFT